MNHWITKFLSKHKKRVIIILIVICIAAVIFLIKGYWGGSINISQSALYKQIYSHPEQTVSAEQLYDWANYFFEQIDHVSFYKVLEPSPNTVHVVAIIVIYDSPVYSKPYSLAYWQRENVEEDPITINYDVYSSNVHISIWVFDDKVNKESADAMLDNIYTLLYQE